MTLKKKLFAHLGPVGGTATVLLTSPQKSMDILGLTSDKGSVSRKTSDVRSRTSSMRTGDASKVMDFLNLDPPRMEKE